MSETSIGELQSTHPGLCKLLNRLDPKDWAIVELVLQHGFELPDQAYKISHYGPSVTLEGIFFRRNGLCCTYVDFLKAGCHCGPGWRSHDGTYHRSKGHNYKLADPDFEQKLIQVMEWHYQDAIRLRKRYSHMNGWDSLVPCMDEEVDH